MLVLRKQQLETIQRASDLRWLNGRLAELYPSFAGASTSQRRDWVAQGVERAERLGLGRSEFLQFLAIEQTWFPGCLDHPDFAWARAAMNNPEETATERLKRLRHLTIHRLLELEAQQELEAQEASALEAFHDGIDEPTEAASDMTHAGHSDL